MSFVGSFSNYKFRARLEDELRLLLEEKVEVVMKEITLPDGTTQTVPVKVYPGVSVTSEVRLATLTARPKRGIT